MNGAGLEASPRASVPVATAELGPGSELDRLIAAHAAARYALDAPGADSDAEAEGFVATVHALDAYVPQTPDEFVQSLAARFSDDEPPTADAVTEIVGIATRLAAAQRVTGDAWSIALADYRTKRALSGAMAPDHPDEDEAADECGLAQDHLVLNVPSPSMREAIIKIEMARKRWEAFAAWPDDWWAAIMVDLRRLSSKDA